jgi:HlyD family secretion protein
MNVNASLDQVSNFEVKVRLLKESYSELIEKYTNPFRPGMTATVDIMTESSRGMLVPIQAVTMRVDSSSIRADKKLSFDKEMECVFVYADGKVTKQEVKTGIQDDRYIELLTGPEEGAYVVTAPYKTITKKLKSGTKVDTVSLDKLYKKD